MSFWSALFSNRIFLSVLLSLLIAQLIKFAVLSVRSRKLRPTALAELAGMPSAHLAVFAALATGIYLAEGVSALFIVAVAIYYYMALDTMTHYKETERHARIIDHLLHLFPGKLHYRPLTKRWGASTGEAMAGTALGIVMALVVFAP